MSSPNEFELSGKIDHFLARLAKLYAHEGEKIKLRIIVNAQVRVQECWTSDNWNGGTYGHALFLTLPEFIYLESMKTQAKLAREITEDVNKVHNFPNEFIAETFLEMEDVEDKDWRKGSGVLLDQSRIVLPDAANRLWEPGKYRVFLSHKSDVKKKTSELKQQFAQYGISGFVAHEDIRPTKQWQDEIENALASMDAFVALLTEDFHKSDWTDQEVGYAVARGVPVIAVKLGVAPYGFIGKFQALSCSWTEAPQKMAKLLLGHPRMVDAYITAARNCRNFDEGNSLAECLTDIHELSETQAQNLVAAYRKNPQLNSSFGFNGAKTNSYGPGLAAHLWRITGKEYALSELPAAKTQTRNK